METRTPESYLEMSFDSLPKTLRNTFANVERHLWSSMDGFVEVVTAWQRGGEITLSQTAVFDLLTTGE